MRKNISLDGMIHFVQADVLDHQDLTGPWDMILSNPPYVLEEEFNMLPDDVRLYEPRVALVGGTTGCEIVQRLIEQSAGRLASGGRLFIEVGPSTVLAAEKIITNTSSIVGEPTVSDGAGLARIVEARTA